MTVNNEFLFKSEVLEYINQLNQAGLKKLPILQEIQEYNANHIKGNMAVANEQINFLVWIANLLKIRNYLEIGVFTGLSSTAMGLLVPTIDKIHACDISRTYTSIAQKFWQKAKIKNKIKLYLQPALITLNDFIESGIKEYFDLIFIDAEKYAIPEYVERCYFLVKSSGLIIIDNVLLQGRVVDLPKVSSLSLKILSEFNKNICKDNRFKSITLPMGDGLILLLKN